MDSIGGRVDAAEPVLQKLGECHVFLKDQATRWDIAGRQQIQQGADSRGRRNLNGAPRNAIDRLRIDLVRVRFLH